MKLHLITHCYAGRLPQYAKLLRFQLEACKLYPSASHKVSVTVCTTPDDIATQDVVSFYAADVDVTCELFQPRHLFRRSIGRNQIGRQSDADLIWFTDADYLLYQGCVDVLFALARDGDFFWPRNSMITKDHETGERILNQADPIINPHDFINKFNRRAIGGIQIVSGDVIREFGYLPDGHKFLKPNQTDAPFPCFRDDIAHRKYMHGLGMVFKPLPGLPVYRIRHKETTYA